MACATSDDDLRIEAQRWMAGILRRKASLKIGIYGSYYPAAEFRRLQSLKNSIKKEGYSSAQLVKDIPELPEFKDEMDKSIFSMKRSNVNLFLLTFRGQKQGAVRELDYVLKNPEHIFKCVVFIETMRRGRSTVRCLTRMLEDDLRAVGMRVAEFTKKKDDELLALARGTLLDFLYYYVRNRPQDLSA
jgi:hypothetical protein